MKTKSVSALIITIAMAFSLSGCEKNSKEYYSSTEDVTIDSIVTMTKPENMIEYKGGFKQTISYSGFNDENIDNAEIYLCYKKSSGKTEINQVAKYPDEYYTIVYMTNDSSDPFVYTKSNMGCMKDDFTEEDFKSMTGESVLGYGELEAVLNSVTSENGSYIADVTISMDGAEAGHDMITIDPKTGYVVKVESIDNTTGQNISVVSEFIYSNDFEIDDSPKKEYVEPADMPVADESSDAEPEAETAE